MSADRLADDGCPIFQDETWEGEDDCPFCEGDGCDECDYTGLWADLGAPGA